MKIRLTSLGGVCRIASAALHKTKKCLAGRDVPKDMQAPKLLDIRSILILPSLILQLSNDLHEQNQLRGLRTFNLLAALQHIEKSASRQSIVFISNVWLCSKRFKRHGWKTVAWKEGLDHGSVQRHW